MSRDPYLVQELGRGSASTTLDGRRVAATLTVLRVRGGLPCYDLTNDGDEPLTYGLGSHLEQWVGEGGWWPPIWPEDFVVPAIGFVLTPGAHSRTFSVMPSGYEPAPGRWQLSVQSTCERGPWQLNLRLQAEFDWPSMGDLPPSDREVRRISAISAEG